MVGSRAFFGDMEGFRSKDTDYLLLTDSPEGFQWRHEQSLRGECTFCYKAETPQQMVQKTLECGDALLVGKFLVAEVAEAIGATVEDILPLEPLLDALDDKHKYVATIFRAVKENGTFALTEEQRTEAYNAYKAARQPQAEEPAATAEDTGDPAEDTDDPADTPRPSTFAAYKAARDAARARRSEGAEDNSTLTKETEDGDINDT